MSEPALSSPHDARRQLSLLDATCIMVGIVIGAGIFRTPSGVAALSPNATVLLGIWLTGGVASLIGALCYAELSTRYPEDGGTFAFLHRAYGPWASLLFAWTDFWIVRPSNLGAIAFILADYAQAAWPLGSAGRLLYAISAVMLATSVHLAGMRAGRWSQNVLSILKVFGLVQVVFAAFTMLPTGAGPATGTVTSTSYLEWSQAFVLVMFCYGGWSDLSYVAAEVRHPSRNMLWAMVLGVTTITLLYLAVNAGVIYALGIPRLAVSETFAADIINLRLDTLTFPLTGRGLSLPSWGDGIIGLLVVISCLGALSGMVFTGARVYFALGLRHVSFAWLGGWNVRRSTPPQSLVAQAVMSCVLIGLAGHDPNGFERLVIFNSPCYWGFTLLAALAVIILRVRDRETPFAFRVPCYPLLPLAFVGICSVLIAASVQYVIANLAIEAIYSAGILLSGGLVTWWTSRHSCNR